MRRLVRRAARAQVARTRCSSASGDRWPRSSAVTSAKYSGARAPNSACSRALTVTSCWWLSCVSPSAAAGTPTAGACVAAASICRRGRRAARQAGRPRQRALTPPGTASCGARRAQRAPSAPAAWLRRRLPRAPWRGRATAASAARGLPTQLVCQPSATRRATPRPRAENRRRARRTAPRSCLRNAAALECASAGQRRHPATPSPPAAIHRPVPRHGWSQRHQLFRAVRPGDV